MTEAAKFAVRIDRGLVTHWGDKPLTTWEQAEVCRGAIEGLTGETGEVERLLLHIPLSAAVPESSDDA